MCWSSSLSKMSCRTPIVSPSAKSVVTAWPDAVHMCITSTNKKILPVDARDVSILKVSSCCIENINVRFVLKDACFSKEYLIMLLHLASLQLWWNSCCIYSVLSVMATNSFVMTVKRKSIVLLVLTLYNRGCLVTIFLMCVTFPKQIMLKKTFH